MYVNFTPISATSGRSPLVSLMFPTMKDKITSVNRFCEEMPTSVTTIEGERRGSSIPRFLPSLELEKIVKLETLNRNSKYSQQFSGVNERSQQHSLY
jgi:hypothetical protein